VSPHYHNISHISHISPVATVALLPTLLAAPREPLSHTSVPNGVNAEAKAAVPIRSLPSSRPSSPSASIAVFVLAVLV